MMSPRTHFFIPSFPTDPNDTIAPPSQDEGITLEMKLAVIRSSLERSDVTLVIFDVKEQLKILHLALGLLPSAWARVEDPKVAAWMMQPSDKERNLPNLAMNFDHIGGNEVSTCLLGYHTRSQMKPLDGTDVKTVNRVMCE